MIKLENQRSLKFLLNLKGFMFIVDLMFNSYLLHRDFCQLMSLCMSRQAFPTIMIHGQWTQWIRSSQSWYGRWVLYPPPLILPDLGRIQVESAWNGRNGWNLVGMSCQWEPTQISLRLQPHSHQIPTIPTGITWIRMDQISTRILADSRWNPVRIWIPADMLT